MAAQLRQSGAHAGLLRRGPADMHKVFPLIYNQACKIPLRHRRASISGGLHIDLRHGALPAPASALFQRPCRFDGFTGAMQVAATAAASDDQAADPMVRFHEHQKGAARISVADEARMLVDVNRYAGPASVCRKP
jgi:hypothetical protein